MSRKGTNAELKKLLNAVPKDGAISNEALRKELGWSRNTYIRRRDELVLRGDLLRGRGRGGTVRRSDPEAAKDSRRESDYYEPVIDYLADVFDFDYDALVIEKTAHGGRKSTGGLWTRPDITLIGLRRTTLYKPGVHVEVHTFELKRVQDTNVTAVHEALQHRRSANFAWVVPAAPSSQHLENEEFQSRFNRIQQESQNHGLGVATFNLKGRPKWTEYVSPQRNIPPAYDIDRFLVGQLSDEGQQAIQEWYEAPLVEDDDDHDVVIVVDR